ncbi:MAG: HdeD family acid-resistance protein [Candidatus Eiseniibacteriota bacterium]
MERRNTLAGVLSRGWWMLLLRGLIAIAFGVLTWMQPAITLVALVTLFGAYAIVDGALAVWVAITGRKENDHWGVLLLGGLLGIGVGILTFMAPGITALALLFYIAIWAIGTGVLAIAAAIRLRKEIQGEFFLILAGLASVAFGVMLIMRPGAGALSVLSLIAAFAVAFGLMMVILAFNVRGFAKKVAA